MRPITYVLWASARFDAVYELEVYLQYSDLHSHFYLNFRHANTATNRHTEKGEYWLGDLDAARQHAIEIFDQFAAPVRVRREFFAPLDQWVP